MLKVTNEMIEIALKKYLLYSPLLGNYQFDRMKAVLQTVFDDINRSYVTVGFPHFTNYSEKPNNSEEQKPENDGWIESNGSCYLVYDAYKDTKLEVQFGDADCHMVYSIDNADDLRKLYLIASDSYDRIIAYRYLKKEKKPENEKSCKCHVCDTYRKIMHKDTSYDDWIEWKGGARPVPPDTKVMVKLQNGTILSNDGNGSPAYIYIWRHHSTNDIAAYRIVKEQPEKKQQIPPPQSFIDMMEGKYGKKVGKKVYKLKKMWKAWYKSNGNNVYACTHPSDTIEDLKKTFRSTSHQWIAITRADATEFYEGEGLD